MPATVRVSVGARCFEAVSWSCDSEGVSGWEVILSTDDCDGQHRLLFVTDSMVSTVEVIPHPTAVRVAMPRKAAA